MRGEGVPGDFRLGRGAARFSKMGEKGQPGYGWAVLKIFFAAYPLKYSLVEVCICLLNHLHVYPFNCIIILNY